MKKAEILIEIQKKLDVSMFALELLVVILFKKKPLTVYLNWRALKIHGNVLLF